ncbi:hypothetical protein T02_5985 [Trichinella nativa]|uniref:Uncharacterized protein n=1 Tax=Trichinella nativa TaxID=6335 RepID=A0A0V1KKC0_9BILA|nr:hypothetical protein T02_5985 [Trichinella nativa]
MNSQLISNYFAHGWYLFETLENSTSMYNGDYYWHLRNECVLYKQAILCQFKSFNPNYTVPME